MKIIYLSLAGIGDYVMQTPAISLLREKYPSAQIDLLTMSKSIALLAKNSKKFDNIYQVQLLGNTFLGIKELIKIGKQNKYDISILGFPAYRKEYHIVHFLLGAKKRLGHKYLSGGDFSELHFLENEKIIFDENIHNVKNNIKLLEKIDIFTKDRDFKCEIFLEEDVNKKIIDRGNFEKNIGIHPGSTNSPAALLRRWGAKNFSELAKKLVNKNCKVFIFGGPEEMDEIEKMQKVLSSEKNIIFVKENFLDSLYILRQMDVLICNDNGFGHLATGLNISVVSLFGNTNPIWSAPYGQKVKIIHNADFAPWYRYELKNSVPKGAKSGMENIKVDDILQVIF